MRSARAGDRYRRPPRDASLLLSSASLRHKLSPNQGILAGYGCPPSRYPDRMECRMPCVALRHSHAVVISTPRRAHNRVRRPAPLHLFPSHSSPVSPPDGARGLGELRAWDSEIRDPKHRRRRRTRRVVVNHRAWAGDTPGYLKTAVAGRRSPEGALPESSAELRAPRVLVAFSICFRPIHPRYRRRTGPGG